MFRIKDVGFAGLCELLREKEDKFGMSSIEFFNRYSAGELGDAREFIEWAGLYRTYLELCHEQIQPTTRAKAAS
ncbi:MAG TPA: hypothetical protein EYP55_06720 [Anaerolineae bacterium]|nr:hypothetical protein [Anaerolineae bacterium]